MPYIGQGLSEGRRRVETFVATANQTTFNVTYDVGYVDVYQNGILLTADDYTATNGSQVVLDVGASLNDEITIIAQTLFTVSDTVSAAQGGTFTGSITASGGVVGNVTGTTSSISNHDTDALSEGSTNLYFTNSRADARISNALSGNVTIGGNLQVDGTTTTINSTTLTVDDKNITLASGSANASAANGAGFTVDLGTDGTATINYDNTNDEWDFNKPIDVSSITVNTLNGGATNFDIKQTTADGSDNKRTRIGGGGDVINTRGAFIELHGNEHTSTGSAVINAGNVTGGEISLRTGGTEKVIITKDGEVGIGTNNPLSGFHISDGTNAGSPQNANRKATLMIDAGATSSADLQFMVRNGYNSHIFFGDAADPNIGMLWYNHNENSMNFMTNTNTAMIINADQNVGIGATIPTGNLTIANPTAYAPSSVSAANSYIQLGSTDYGSGGSSNNDGKFMIGFGYTDGATNTNSPAYIGFEETSTSGDTKGDLTFYTRNVITDTQPTKRMTIADDGNVGIGTSSGANLLNIHQTDASSNSYLHITHVDGGSGASNGLSIGLESDGVNAVIRNRENGYLRMYTNNTERMRIDSLGRLGIATGGAVNTNAHANADDLVIGNTSNRTGMTIVSAANSNGNIHFSDGTSSGNADISGQISYEHTDNSFRFYANSTTEVLRLTSSGGTVFNNGQDINQNFTVKASGNANAFFIDGNGGQVTIGGGSIQLTGGGVISSNGTSDTIVLSGSNAEHVGAGITLHGNAHSNASQTWFKAGSTTVMKIAGGRIGMGRDPSSSIGSYLQIQSSDGISLNRSGQTNPIIMRNLTSTEGDGVRFTLYNTGDVFKVKGDGMRVIGYSNSATSDNISVDYKGTAGGHMSGYLFRDKRDAVNAAIKNDLQDDSTTNYAAHLRFQTAHAGTLTTQMTIDRYGQVMMPNQPSFRAYTSTDYTTNQTMEGSPGVWVEQHDNNNDFSNGRFTAPVDGVYLFEVMWDALGTQSGINLLVNANTYRVKWEPTGRSDNAWESRHYSTTVKLSSGDYVRLVGVHGSGANPFHMGGGHWGSFSGHLLG